MMNLESHGADDCFCHGSRCDIQPWARAAYTFTAVASVLHETVNEYRLRAWVIITMTIVDVDDSSRLPADSQHRLLGLRVGSYLELSLHSSSEPGELSQRLWLLSSGVARNFCRLRIIWKWETQVPQWGPGAKSRWGYRVMPPEADDFMIIIYRILTTG